MHQRRVPAEPPSRSLGPLGAGRVRRAEKAGAEAEWRARFVDEFGELDLVPDRPRAAMRVLGFMVVCRPPVQSAHQIMDALVLSAGSVSTALNALHDDGLLERVNRAGDRHVYYRLTPQGWGGVVEARFQALIEARRAADRALQAARGEADHRLRQLSETCARLEAGLAELLTHDV